VSDNAEALAVDSARAFLNNAPMKTAIMIDGGFLRASAKSASLQYDNTFIEKFARSCVTADEYLFRIYYYDAPQFRGKVTLPVSGNETNFQASDKWLDSLAKLERFAVRRGTIGFRGWKPKSLPISGAPLTDQDFSPIFEQKGVDMRIGLDIAIFSQNNSVDRIVLVSGDTDMIPAMKHARKSGLEVVLIQLPPPALTQTRQIQGHADIVRFVSWPE
jgi:uncharacterized LabA/DUF88 family protein